jgi:hypothetical protein
LIHRLMTAATIALYMTAAFALVPALGSAEGAGPSEASRAALEGVLVAIGLMVVTVGTAVARWFREERPEV